MNLRLTPRQREVMLLKCRDGLTNAEIGYRLGISQRTVKNHVSAVLHAHQVAASAEVCWALAQEEARQEDGN